MELLGRRPGRLPAGPLRRRPLDSRALRGLAHGHLPACGQADVLSESARVQGEQRWGLFRAQAPMPPASAAHTNGVANGTAHRAGLQNGHAAALSNGAVMTNGKAHVADKLHGASNGHANGHANGVASGHANGVANGHANGVANGHA